MDVFNIADVPAFITKDGSEIRELLAYRNSLIVNQSLAEARVPVGGSTIEIITRNRKKFTISPREMVG